MQKKQWLLPAFVVAGALCLFLIGSKLNTPANAQAELLTDINSEILVIPVQMVRDSYGLVMVDTNSQTLWVYEKNSRGPAHKRLRLLAAQNWQYDRLLQYYNTAQPRPEQIKEMLENIGQPHQKTNKSKP
jgi:hypothetical protein